ncbi:MAG: hypothetical protein JXQ72_09720 [Anaerolineae bacterium]|nr:hypothetical protein [Anaerolineae bacterium]
MQPDSLTQLFTRHKSGWLIVFTVLLVSLFAGLIAAALYLADDPQPQSPTATDQGATHGLQAPVFLLNGNHPALVWRPLDSSTPLSYQSLNPPEAVQGIIPYNDVNPRTWAAVPAGPDGYHLVWLEPDGRLRSALITVHGETVRGPIELASIARRDFTLLSLSGDRALLLWTSDPAGYLVSAVIDRAGRPGPISAPLTRRVDHMTAALDRNDTLHLVWLTRSAPGEWALNYQSGEASNPDRINLDNPHSLHTLALAPGENVTSFQIGLDETHGYAIWGITAAKQPDIERVVVLAFPLDNPANNAIHELQWAGDAALRWPRTTPGQHTIMPLAVALRTPDGWRPAVGTYQGGTLRDYQIVASQAANAGPPTIAIAPDGDLYLAWSGLKGAAPHTYTTQWKQKGF